MNQRANGCSLGFFKLVRLLFQECQHVSIAVRLVSNEIVIRNQRQKFKDYQGVISRAWERYENREIEPMELLRFVADKNGPLV